jgi:hypothetical protein
MGISTIFRFDFYFLIYYFVKDEIGAGVAACYRGYRLYDTDVTKALVTKWVNFYKKYRSILIRDIIHVRKKNLFLKNINY